MRFTGGSSSLYTLFVSACVHSSSSLVGWFVLHCSGVGRYRLYRGTILDNTCYSFIILRFAGELWFVRFPYHMVSYRDPMRQYAHSDSCLFFWISSVLYSSVLCSLLLRFVICRKKRRKHPPRSNRSWNPCGTSSRYHALRSCSVNRAKMLHKSYLEIIWHSQYNKVVRLLQHSSANC